MAKLEFADLEGLNVLVNHLKGELAGKVDKETGKGLSSNDFTDTLKNKLEGIAAGATKVTVDSSLSTSSENPVQNKTVKAELDKKMDKTQKGAAGGIAELGSDGKVPAAQLPGFVDDIVEGYLNGGKFYKESTHTTNIEGEASKMYVDLTTNKAYRWSGTAFVEVSASLALGTTSNTAFRGDWGKTAYDHSQSPHAPTTLATASADGLMAKGDKSKLDGIGAIPTADIEALFA